MVPNIPGDLQHGIPARIVGNSQELGSNAYSSSNVRIMFPAWSGDTNNYLVERDPPPPFLPLVFHNKVLVLYKKSSAAQIIVTFKISPKCPDECMEE